MGGSPMAMPEFSEHLNLVPVPIKVFKMPFNEDKKGIFDEIWVNVIMVQYKEYMLLGV